MLNSLSAEQAKVVEFRGNALLTACPGSGKTRTVAAKIAHHAGSRSRSSRRWVLAITHTKVAAEEILERLDKSGVDDPRIWVGTIHSFCMDWIIKPYAGSHHRVSSGFRIINEFEQAVLKDELKKDAGISIWDELPTKLGGDFALPADMPAAVRNAALAYHRELEAKKLIDFDLILSIASSILADNISIGSRLASVFELLIVDEYQDLSQEQYDIISHVTRHRRTQALLVGDVDQAIYTTLGAVVKNITELEEQLGVSKIREFSLSGCYRSTQTIIEFYKRFQDNKIDIKSRRSPSPIISQVTYSNDVSLADLGGYVAELVRQHMLDGVAPREIVVLAPLWHDAAKLGRSLQQSLPSIRVDSPNSSPLPKSFENGWQSFLRLRSTPPGTDTYSRRRRMAASVLEDLRAMGFEIDENDSSIRRVLIAANEVGHPANEQIDNYVSRSVTDFCGRLGLDMSAQAEAVTELSALIDAINSRLARLDISNDAAQLRVDMYSKEAVRVTTYHSTKGEEYDVVVATGLLEGKVPHWDNIIDRTAEHSAYVARRLLYVASSRARFHLHLVSEVGHRTKSGRPYKPTRYISWGS